ncbi:MAG TPA: twin-arginine translocation signal domain-containing protein, partial [Bacteroidales bacterium]|nr:twin-arginine translocation signal domain-containing protein [Bacteroidales bacterium]
MDCSRRNFLKTSAVLAATAAVTSPAQLFAKGMQGQQKKPASGKMDLTFEPFEAKMKHVFTIANFSRSTTPIVLTRITWNGYTGYGEASMPPYLGETTASVIEFLKKVDLGRFSSPFQMEEILT